MTLTGIVQSHTVVRVGAKQVSAPFVLLLVELDDGRQLLGRFDGGEAPPIRSRVTASPSADQTPVFSLTQSQQ